MDDTPHEDDRPETGESVPEHSPLEDDRYRHVSVGDHVVVIYDREQPEAYLKSDFAVDIGD